jgi:general secretion pathway protein D
MVENHPSGAKQASETGQNWGLFHSRRLQGLKPETVLIGLVGPTEVVPMVERHGALASGGVSLAHRSRRFLSMVALAAICAIAALPAYAESANSMYKHAVAAEAREDYDTAYDLYQKAMLKAPADVTYKAAFQRVKVSASGMHMAKGRKLLEGGDEQGALVEFIHASEIDPGNDAAQQEITRIRKNQGQAAPQGETSLEEQGTGDQDLASMGSPVVLKPLSNEPLTLHYAGDAKEVYQAIGKAAGLNVLFDPDYTSKRITVDLTNESLMDALRIVGTMSNTFWHPVTENTIFVAQNTVQKRRDLEETAIQTFYLTNAWQPNDLTDVMQAVRNVLTGGSLKIYGVPSQNAIVVRGTPDELLVAQKLINDLDKPRPEVVVDIAIMQVSKNWERTLGIQWPSSVGIALQPPTSSTTSTTTTSTTGTSTDTGTTPSLYDLSHLKATDFAVTVGSATANLLFTDSNTKILQSPRIRATDAQKATMKIGERIPIATGSYGGGGLGGVGATGGLGIGVQTQFQYQDVGVNIEMTPTVHYDHEVTLKIKIDISSQASSVTISGVTEPIIAQNVVDQVIRLREGEASILGGINEKQDQVSWSGIPGLSSIPILRYLFGSKDHTITDTDLVFVVVPHIVRSQMLDRDNLRTIDTGAGNTIELRHIAMPLPDGVKAAPDGTNASPDGVRPAPGVQTPGPGVRPPPQPRSTIGVVPGQSAMAAAPAAMAQMNASAEANGQTAAKAATAPPLPGVSGVNVMFSPPSNPVAAGSTFQVPVILNGGKDIAEVPLQVQYDPTKLSLVNVTGGDLLGRDNQAVSVVHRDDGSGTINIDTARPPGVAGVSGSGVVCVLSFQAKAAGDTTLSMTPVSILNSAKQQIPAQGSRANISVH